MGPPRRYTAWVYALAAGAPLTALCGCAGCGGTPGGPPGAITHIPQAVWDYVVHVATETGEWVQAKAQTLGEAISRAWRKAFPEIDRGVEVDPSDPLKGRLRGRFHYKVIKV